MDRAKHILIVEDDAEFRAAIRELLEDEHCTVYEAADGKAALDILRNIVPDLILLDLLMPGMNGWDFHNELQKDPALAQIPIAILSGATGRRPSGPMHMLHKPVTLP